MRCQMPVVDSLTQSAIRSVNKKQDERDAIWSHLGKLKNKIAQTHLAERFVSEPNRAKKFTLKVDKLSLDYSKNHIDETVMLELVRLAQSYDLKTAIDQLFNGYAINVTEKRPALHNALRRPVSDPLVVEGKNVMEDVFSTQEKMRELVNSLQKGEWLGASHKVITDVVNIGIGGSDLGPQMVSQALKPFWNTKVNVHFVANIDPTQFDEIVEPLNPETTLFLVSSKSFSTIETLTNAKRAKQWLSKRLHAKQLDQHFIGITANPARAIAWGINKENILPFWAWVGGRFSIWSSIGFPIALLIGMDQFRAFLDGGHAMDRHFLNAPMSENMPVVLALLGIWYRNFWQAPSLAICPYSYLLRNFPSYIQQLDMESNGKSQQPNGDLVKKETAPIIWGGEGTNTQHAFFQLLHQGCHFVPVDFILTLNSISHDKHSHQQLVINAVAQAKALMEGNPMLSTQDQPLKQVQGNKPSNLLMLEALTPYSLGQLIALYEHKIFVQGVIWQINSFDQPGVELGKQLANELTSAMNTKGSSKQVDSSSACVLRALASASSE